MKSVVQPTCALMLSQKATGVFFMLRHFFQKLHMSHEKGTVIRDLYRTRRFRTTVFTLKRDIWEQFCLRLSSFKQLEEPKETSEFLLYLDRLLLTVKSWEANGC